MFCGSCGSEISPEKPICVGCGRVWTMAVDEADDMDTENYWLTVRYRVQAAIDDAWVNWHREFNCAEVPYDSFADQIELDPGLRSYIWSEVDFDIQDADALELPDLNFPIFGQAWAFVLGPRPEGVSFARASKPNTDSKPLKVLTWVKIDCPRCAGQILSDSCHSCDSKGHWTFSV